jgi:hypothetical protein
MSTDIAPAPHVPERFSPVFERKIAPSIPGQRGPTRFEEGLATDTDVPNEFTKGVSQGYITAPGRPNHNANVWEKPASETLQERVHVGSAAWVEAPTFLGEFAHGSFAEHAHNEYEQVDRGKGLGRRWERISPAVVQD